MTFFFLNRQVIAFEKSEEKKFFKRHTSYLAIAA